MDPRFRVPSFISRGNNHLLSSYPVHGLPSRRNANLIDATAPSIELHQCGRRALRLERETDHLTGSAGTQTSQPRFDLCEHWSDDVAAQERS